MSAMHTTNRQSFKKVTCPFKILLKIPDVITQIMPSCRCCKMLKIQWHIHRESLANFVRYNVQWQKWHERCLEDFGNIQKQIYLAF